MPSRGGRLWEAADWEPRALPADRPLRPEVPSGSYRGGAYVAATRTACRNSRYLLQNVELFGRLGGFDALKVRLCDRSRPLPAESVAALLRPAVQCRYVLSRESMAHFVPGLVEAAMAHLLLTKGDALKRGKEYFEGPRQQLESLLVHVVSPKQASKNMELFDLRVALVLVTSPYLEKKVQGANEIKNSILVAMAGDRGKKGALAYLSSVVAGPTGPSDNLSITADEIACWVLDDGVLETLLAPDTTHIELVRRSFVVLHLLQTSGRLQKWHLDALWRLAAEDQHESMQHLVFELVGKLAEHLPVPMLQHLFGKISERPFGAYDAQTVQLIKEFSVHALERQQQEPAQASSPQHWYGLTLCWSMLQSSLQQGDESEGIPAGSPQLTRQPSSNRLGDHVAKDVEECFVALLALDTGESMRPLYMQRCVENLESGNAVAPSLRLLEKIIRTYPAMGKGWFGSSAGAGAMTMQAVLEMLERRHGIVDLVVHELGLFKAKTISAGEQPQGLRINTGGSISCHVDMEYVEQIQTRQAFLVFVLSFSSLQLNEVQLVTLWNDLVTSEHASAEERDYTFRWLTNACGREGPWGLLPVQLQELFFRKRVVTLDPVTLTQDGFALLRRYLLVVNERLGYLQVGLGDNVTVVRHDQIVGIECLWGAATRNPVEVVGRAALDLLHTLHSSVSSRARSRELDSARATLRQKCLSHLSGALKEQGQGNSSRLVIARSMQLLQRHLEGNTRVADSQKIVLQVVPDRELRVRGWELTASPRHTIGWLRQEICAVLQIRGNRGVVAASVTLKVGKVRLVGDAADLNSAHLRSGDTVQVGRLHYGLVPKHNRPGLLPMPLSFPTERLLEQCKLLPARRLMWAHRVQARRQSGGASAADETSFDELFALLQGPKAGLADVAHEIWNVLMLLPLDRALLERFKELPVQEKEDWDALFDLSSPYRLLYGLKAMASHLAAGSSDRNWGADFVRKGGVIRLLQLALSGAMVIGGAGSGVQSEVTACLFWALDHTLAFDPDYRCVEDTGSASVEAGSMCLAAAYEKLVCDAVERTVLPALTRLSAESGSDVAVDGFRLLVGCARTWPRVAEIIANEPRFLELVQLNLVDRNDADARTHVATALLALAQSDTAWPVPDDSPVQGQEFWFFHYVQLLQQPQVWQSNCKQLSLLLAELLGAMERPLQEGSRLEAVLHGLTGHLHATLSSYQSVETHESGEPDPLLYGLLVLLRALAHKRVMCETQQMIELATTVYHRCLFDVGTELGIDGTAVCISHASRQAAFALLQELTQQSIECRSEIVALVLRQEGWRRTRMVWNYEPAVAQRDNNELYVGLKNQGATCYLNSFMQQLFHTPGLVAGVMGAKGTKIEDTESEEKEDGAATRTVEPAQGCDNKDGSLLYQLQ